MRSISEFFRNGELDALRGAYSREATTALLSGTLPALYPGARAYVDGIARTLYPEGGGGPLAAVDRERCILVLEAARGGRFTLAVHVYVGLMEGLAVEEIAQLLLLAGVYAGVGVFAGGLQLLVRVLSTLEEVVAARGPLGVEAVFAALRSACPE
jgi:alkylhydroperoxidase/carboxymuconolactone decarboxylase family protein YurZ